MLHNWKLTFSNINTSSAPPQKYCTAVSISRFIEGVSKNPQKSIHSNT